MKKIHRLKLVKRLLVLFIICLFISGLTAIPVEWQLTLLIEMIPPDTGLFHWIDKVLMAYKAVNKQYPFLLYGYDWLAFAHFVLAMLFIGPYKDPIKNIWVIQFGLITCLLIIPFAFIAGHYRGIPVGWRLIDCSFGVIGFAVLGVCYKQLQYIFSSSLQIKKYHESI